MENIINNYTTIKNSIKDLNKPTSCQIVVVTKTFPIEKIKPLINQGHTHFGENKVQEAEKKWSTIKESNSNIKLHLIGGLQSNKAKKAFRLFDFIHSLDNYKLAKIFSNLEKDEKKKIKYFIQVNIGNESQKSGIDKKDLMNFYIYCKEDLNLDIIGLMCIPPASEDSSNFFKEMKSLKKSLNLKDLSMGMSSDYLNAIEYEATYVRVGSKIFGNRN